MKSFLLFTIIAILIAFAAFGLGYLYRGQNEVNPIIIEKQS
jgi:hypothetical protein|tara:strand:+ start:1444 stop:1566 length:123 start_codon:yes stop_codon:yes gene_type:complete